MITISRSTGLGLLGYGVGTAVAFLASGSPGGSYSDANVATYVSSGHFAVAAGCWLVGAFAALALLVVANGLRALPGTGRLLAGLTGVGAAAGIVGAFVSGGLAVAMSEGGAAVRRGVPHSVVYTITEIGNLLAICAPALCVGVAGIVLAGRHGLPSWLRVFSFVAGICGILAPIFVTWFVFVTWTVVLGIALAVRRSPAASTRPVPSLV